jgi:hypothetical protein
MKMYMYDVILSMQVYDKLLLFLLFFAVFVV